MLEKQFQVINFNALFSQYLTQQNMQIIYIINYYLIYKYLLLFEFKFYIKYIAISFAFLSSKLVIKILDF